MNHEGAGLEDWLIAGGDDRLALGADGLNKYGCSPTPRSAVALGSCTASSISPRAHAAAAHAWQRLADLTQGAPARQVLDAEAESIRTELKRLLRLEDLPLEVVLSPSGTDAEFVALSIMALRRSEPILSIVVGPREIGSGSALAAAGLHFSSRLPCGAEAVVGLPVDVALAQRVTVREVHLRHDDACVRAPDELDDEVVALVHGGLAAGSQVLVHVVAHSKTGVHAPRLETVNNLLSRHGDRVAVVIDAAQGRVSRRGLREYLGRGCMVIFTGSKFYGGPPFSGALLVPAAVLPADGREPCTEAGLAAYLTAAEVPAHWTRSREALGDRCNPGLLLRWHAALAELRAYYAVDPAVRLAILRHMEAQAPRRLGAARVVQVLDEPAPVWADETERLLESKRTVFSLAVQDRQQRRLDAAALKQLAALLNTDQGARFARGSTASATASATFHVGQPVTIGKARDGRHPAVLRVALGGSLIADLADAAALGTTVEDRLAWLDAQLDGLARKIDLLVNSMTEPTP